MKKLDSAVIEKKWQTKWETENTFAASASVNKALRLSEKQSSAS